MSIISRFHLQPYLNQLYELIHSFSTINDVLPFLTQLSLATNLLVNISDKIRNRENKYGTQIPDILLCQIFSFFTDIDKIRYGEWICYGWCQALNSTTARSFFRHSIKLPGKIFYLRKALQGDPFAQGKLAECYQRGIGVQININESYKWALTSCIQEHPEGQVALGWCYEMGGGGGGGKFFQKDIKKALLLYRLSATTGNPRGLYELGCCYRDGIEVEEDQKEKMRLWKLSANLGYYKAQQALGIAYEKEKKFLTAFKWFHCAALQGNSAAQFSISTYYSDGKGIHKDFNERFYWLQNAVHGNRKEAQNNLAHCYYQGEGVQQDLTKAIYWFKLAAQQGCLLAQNNLELAIKVKKNVTEPRQPSSG